ncbi:MAG: ABC transporter substrate-binding protein [Candidatus Hodarchaeota archaeon]
MEAMRLDPYTFGFGTRPYRCTEINAEDFLMKIDDNMTLKAVDTYWKGNVTTDEIIIRRIPSDGAQALTALQNGSVQLLDNSLNDFGFTPDELQDKEGMKLLPTPKWQVQTIEINMNHPILGTGEGTPLGEDDPSRAREAARYVRQAISHMVPRQDIVDEIFTGNQWKDASPAVGGSMILPIQRGFDDSLEPHPNDLEKTKELMTKAGYVYPADSSTTTSTTKTTSSSQAPSFPFVGFLSALIVLAIITVEVGKRYKIG